MQQPMYLLNLQCAARPVQLEFEILTLATGLDGGKMPRGQGVS